jgi:hypothetical protein
VDNLVDFNFDELNKIILRYKEKFDKSSNVNILEAAEEFYINRDSDNTNIFKLFKDSLTLGDIDRISEIMTKFLGFKVKLNFNGYKTLIIKFYRKHNTIC